jgi:hypothetical protein
MQGQTQGQEVATWQEGEEMAWGKESNIWSGSPTGDGTQVEREYGARLSVARPSHWKGPRKTAAVTPDTDAT